MIHTNAANYNDKTHREPGWSRSSVTRFHLPVSGQWEEPPCDAPWSGTEQTSAADLCSFGIESLRWAGAAWPVRASVLGTARAPRHGRNRRCPCCRSCMLLQWFCSGRSWRSRCRAALVLRMWQVPLRFRWGESLQDDRDAFNHRNRRNSTTEKNVTTVFSFPVCLYSISIRFNLINNNLIQHLFCGG